MNWDCWKYAHVNISYYKLEISDKTALVVQSNNEIFCLQDFSPSQHTTVLSKYIFAHSSWKVFQNYWTLKQIEQELEGIEFGGEDWLWHTGLSSVFPYFTLFHVRILYRSLWTVDKGIVLWCGMCYLIFSAIDRLNLKRIIIFLVEPSWLWVCARSRIWKRYSFLSKKFISN